MSAKKEKEQTVDEAIEADEKRRDGDIEVDVSAPDDDVEEVEDVAPAPSRQQKKTERGNLRKETETLREENARLSRENAEARARAAEAAGWVQGQQRAQQGQQQDPIDAELDAITERNQSLGRSYSAEEKGMTAERLAWFQKEATSLKRREQELIAHKVLRSQQPSQQQAQAHQNLQLMQARYPDLMTNNTALAWADARFRQLVAEGHPSGWDTVDLAMNESRARHSPGSRKPDPTMANKLQAQPKGAAAPAGGGGQRVILTQKDQEMADAAFEHIKDPKKRYQEYAKLVSKKSA